MKTREERDANDIDPECVENLNYIVENADAKVVISSTWRLSHTPDEMRNLLEKKGFRGEVLGFTPCEWGEERGIEIQKWLDAHPTVTQFVILDDDSDMAHLKHRLVLTSCYRGGLTRVRAVKALALLGCQAPEEPALGLQS
jgi:hypothetical protein